MSANSTTSRKSQKPRKPRPDFPLFPHATGRWAKKVRGKLHYFGKWDDPDGALEKWLAEKDDLYAGREPRTRSEGRTVRDILNLFLTSRRNKLDAGELSARTLFDYKVYCDEIAAEFGLTRTVADLRPGDFAKLRSRLTAKWGPHRLKGAIPLMRFVFNWGYENDYLKNPVKFGSDFKAPSALTMRLHRRKNGKMYSPDDLKAMLDAADPLMTCVILLGVNGGLKNSDISEMTFDTLDLDAGWLDMPRPKTGIERRVPLWPETVAAIRAWRKVRPEPKTENAKDKVFMTSLGNVLNRHLTFSALSPMYKRLGTETGTYKRGRGLAALRHVFRTVADSAGDQRAAAMIMGHEIGDMATMYVEAVSDERLRKVADHVREWLFDD